jgi:molecular chaperone DnaK (HSP70)
LTAWAIDLGTTNTAVARWDGIEDRPRLVELPEICRNPRQADPLEAPRVVPSATRLLDHLDLASRLGRRSFFARHFFLGKQAIIGRPATEMEEVRRTPAYVGTFKYYLEREPRRPIARTARQAYSARDVARIYLRELFAEVKRVTGERMRDVVVTAPVDAYESYRAELADVGRHLGVKRLRFLDEPVAAALGYGLGIQKTRISLVVDFGGGTMHVALVRLTPKEVEKGSCEVIAKEGRLVGGNLVDRWLLRTFAKKLDYRLVEDPEEDPDGFWWRTMLAEACRVKEAVFFRESDTFHMTPTEDLRAIEAKLRGASASLPVTRDDVKAVLAENGLYGMLDECLDHVMARAGEGGITPADVDDVLMVGGSSLLPDVYGALERRFGRDRVRAWQPFEAVAYGGAAFASGAFGQSDFIVHDYAFVTHDARTHEPQYTVIVPKGTRFPTTGDFWKRQLVPTCSLGEPETLFKLLICEIGDDSGNERRFGWDAQGNLHKMGGKDPKGDRMIVPLNESNPTLGYLRPPHPPSDRRPRLEISFEVNADRWLCASVLDLMTRRPLMKQEPVIRLL